MNNRILFKNAILPQNNGNLKVDLFVEGNKIKQISKSINISNCEIVDVSDKIIFPAFVDIHCHFHLKLDSNLYSRDDFETGTKAAVCGGIGTIGDFTSGNYYPSSDLNKRLKEAKSSYCDYFFHYVIKDIKNILDLKKKLYEAKNFGFRSVKIFTAYTKRGLRLLDCFFPYLLNIASKLGLIICVHAEDDDLIEYRISNFYKNKIPVKFHHKIRDEFSENYAVYKLLKLNELFGATIYFVHISSLKSLEMILKYRTMGYNVYAETCPQYIIFDDSIYYKKDSHLYTFTPPVRDKFNKKMLIENLRYFDVVSSDSCGFNKEDKEKFKDDVLKIPMGISSAQLTSSIIYTFGVQKGFLTLFDMQKILSSNSAKIFSLKNKGKIELNYDADICIFDPNIEFIVKNSQLYHKTNYSCYEGIKLKGKVTSLYLRGREVYKQGIFKSPPFGQFI
ncbi:MAG: amidohydrolase family protein [Elusimicrobiales bacterium]|nr:amidohydrolase family protein [Elusimicrobiales bacterium]